MITTLQFEEADSPELHDSVDDCTCPAGTQMLSTFDTFYYDPEYPPARSVCEVCPPTLTAKRTA